MLFGNPVFDGTVPEAVGIVFVHATHVQAANAGSEENDGFFVRVRPINRLQDVGDLNNISYQVSWNSILAECARPFEIPARGPE